jgi:hypothetical protein
MTTLPWLVFYSCSFWRVTGAALNLANPEQFLAALATFLGLRQHAGFPEKRFLLPNLLGEAPYFAVTKDRKACFEELLTGWEEDAQAIRGAKAHRTVLRATPSAPGTGKTRFVSVAAARGLVRDGAVIPDAAFASALGKVGAEFRTALEEAVGVAVTFNFKTGTVAGEAADETLVGRRMLYSHFVRHGLSFLHFCEWLSAAQVASVEIVDALAIIRHDVDTNSPRTTSGARRHIVLVVDELLAAARLLEPGQPQQNVLTLIASGLGRACAAQPASRPRPRRPPSLS